MSALDNFVNRYANQQLTDNSGNYKGECLSLVKRYAQEVQNVPNADSVLYAINGAAKDLWLSPQPAQNQYYDKVNSPQAGDIAVYTNGTYGDVAVYLGNGQVFGQLGTPVFQPAAVRSVGTPTGYLRLKGQDMPTLANETFVKAAYQIVLGRDASEVSQDEINANVGKQVDTLFFELAASAERDSLNKQVITDFFKGALQRNPSESELQGWLTHGLRNQAEGITGSVEAKAVTKQYNSGTGGTPKVTINGTEFVPKG